MTLPNNCPVQEGIQDLVCKVVHPDLSYDLMCYRPGEHICTPQQQLCPISAPYSCGTACYRADEYSCQVDEDNFFNSQLEQLSTGFHPAATCFVYNPVWHFSNTQYNGAVATPYDPETQACVASCNIPLPFANTLPLEANAIVTKGNAACGAQEYDPTQAECIPRTELDDPFCAYADLLALPLIATEGPNQATLGAISHN